MMGEGITIPNIKHVGGYDSDNGSTYLYNYSFSKFDVPLGSLIMEQTHYNNTINDIVQQFKDTLEQYINEIQTQNLIDKIS